MSSCLLCFHGSQQNAEILRTRMGRIVSKARKSTRIEFIDAPHRLPLLAGDEIELRTWSMKEDESSIETSLAAIEACWKIIRPDGLFGFSLGGSIATLICMQPNRFPGLKYVILAGARDVEELASVYFKGTIPNISRDIQSLHLAGRIDAVVPWKSSETLSQRFTQASFLVHEQGHCIPSKSEFITKVVEFVEQHCTTNSTVSALSPPLANSATTASTSVSTTISSFTPTSTTTTGRIIPPPPPPTILLNCTSTSNAEQQRDEIEAILAIYPDADVKLLRSPPNGISEPSACFSFLLRVVDTTTKEDATTTTTIPSNWMQQLRLIIDFPPGYPDDLNTPPTIEVDVGSLSMMDFPSSIRKSLLTAVREVASSNVGTPCAFACISAANEWLTTGAWLTAQQDTTSSSGNNHATTNNNNNNNTKTALVTKETKATGNSSGGGGAGGAGGGGGGGGSMRSTHGNDNSTIMTLMQIINRYDGEKYITSAESEEEELRENEYVRIATEEACKMAAINAATHRKNEPMFNEFDLLDEERQEGYGDDDEGEEQGREGGRDSKKDKSAGSKGMSSAISASGNNGVTNNDILIAPSASARGIWNYCIGLVGKPSAGKSTFYNAATRAILRGRKMAEVAPHPFTTIEPNVGPGWFAGPADNDGECCGQGLATGPGLAQGSGLATGPGLASGPGPGLGRSALHGRDCLGHGRRLLPVLIKDVAGLVPGAYKGRGKGNRFLNDICDADVLVHVVDATGRSDRDGNMLAGGEQGSSPGEDAQWIREELHRWVYGNVRSKWQSVCRKRMDKSAVGQRVRALFSGYKGTSRLCLDRAAGPTRANLDLDKSPEWTPLDVHRLVAHYLAIRFPVCLALNKIDAFEEEDEIETAKSGESGGVGVSVNSGGNGNGSMSASRCRGREIIRLCQHQARERGELAVPVSAFTETWDLLKQAAAAGQGLGSASGQGLGMDEKKIGGEVDTVGSIMSSTSLSSSATTAKTTTTIATTTTTSSSTSTTLPLLPLVGSVAWNKAEAATSRVQRLWGTSGVLEALSAAVSLRPPVYCYPVSDLDTEAPVGWTSSMHTVQIDDTISTAMTANHASGSGQGGSSGSGCSHHNPKLRDCLMLKPGSTVSDVYDALKRGALSHVIVHGDFVRAEGKGLNPLLHKKRQLGRDTIIDETCSILRIQTNRKAVWQQHLHHQSVVPGVEP